MTLFYRILTGRYLAIPLFLLIMILIFSLTFHTAGAFLHMICSTLMSFFADIIGTVMTEAGAPPALHSLLIDGIFAGVGSVISFVPTIAVLFTCLFILEESGYMSFVAFAMAGLMKRLGLPGEAVVPLLIGFGCSVPAIMAASNLRERKARHLTISLIPFMSCSAKLPIYTVFVTIFFPEHKVMAMSGIYLAGICLAVLYALVLKKTLYGIPLPALPAIPQKCRLPSMSKVFIRVKYCLLDFIKKIFTVVLLASVFTWFLQSFDMSLHPADSINTSILAYLGKYAAPLFEPLGFGDWRVTAAILAGFMAKEAVISTLAVIASGSHGAFLSTMLPEIFTPSSAFIFMVFCLLYIPCIATMVTMKKETESGLFVAGAAFFQLALAWTVCFLLFHIFSYCIS